MFRFKVFVILSVLLIQLPAQAYIPPSWFIVKNMSQKKKGFKWVRIRTALQEVLPNETLGEKLKVTTVMDYEKESLKTTVSLENGSLLQQKEEPLSHTQSSLGAVLLFASHPETIIAALKTFGLNIPDENATPDQKEVTFLSRAGEKFVWGFGSRELPPQLWVEKDKFLPLKIIGKTPSDSAEVSFGSYQYSREFPYSSQVDARVGSFRFRETFEDGLVLSSAEKEKRKAVDQPKVPSTDAQAKLIQKYFEVLR